MPAPNSFPLVRGRIMRVTKVDNCGAPIYGADNQVVTDGFVSVALTANINEPEEILITNANGKTCVRDAGCPEFQGYNAEITFCDVSPCLFSLVTGQPSVTDAYGDVAGFRMNSSVSACDQGFALEVWMGVPGVACTSASGGAYGYLLLPFLQSGVVGDFTIENAAITFAVTGAVTKDGTGWGVGPHEPVEDNAGNPSRLPNPLDPDDHLYVVYTPIAPPVETDGCVPLVALPPIIATAVNEGSPGWYTPSNANPPADLAALTGVPAVPTTAWAPGSYVTLADGTEAYWNGTAWAAGRAPATTTATGATQGAPGAFTPAGSTAPLDVAAMATVTASPTTAWTAGNYVVLGDASETYWNSTAWTVGRAP